MAVEHPKHQELLAALARRHSTQSSHGVAQAADLKNAVNVFTTLLQHGWAHPHMDEIFTTLTDSGVSESHAAELVIVYRVLRLKMLNQDDSGEPVPED